MREMKFRGRSLINGKWVIGDSFKRTANASGNGLPVLTYIGGRVEHALKPGAMKWIPVDPETVGQFTGVSDIEGKEIYEGDICLIHDREQAVVTWKGCAFHLYEKNKSGETHMFDYFFSPLNMIRVIGNIHDEKNKKDD